MAAGLVVLPTAIVNSTPLDCSLCKSDLCPKDYVNATGADPQNNAWWVKKFCTFQAVDPFMIYFPYILFVVPIILVLIEWTFNRAFKATSEMNDFYQLLVDESIISNQKSDADKPENNEPSEKSDHEKTHHEILALKVSQKFGKNSKNLYRSYLWKTWFELVVSMLLFLTLLAFGVKATLPTFDKYDRHVFCEVGYFWYICSGVPKYFYFSILCTSLLMLVAFIVSSVFTLLWIYLPQLGSLSGFMDKFKGEMYESSQQQQWNDLQNVYFGNLDIKLLLDLLASKSGIAPCIKLLSIFDTAFATLTQVRNISVSVEMMDDNEQDKKTEVKVEFNDSVAIDKILATFPNDCCSYMVELISDDTEESVAQAVIQQDLVPKLNSARMLIQNSDRAANMTCCVSTVLNGITIAKTTTKLK